MLVAIIHNREDSIDCLFIIQQMGGTVENMTMSQNGRDYRTLVYTTDKAAVEGLEYHIVGMDKIYTINLNKTD